MKEKIFDHIDERRDTYISMADYIFDHPELGCEEFEASSLLIKALEKEGFTVEKGIAGLPTAFRAQYQQGQGGPVLGLLAEYDALEGLGHGCGHHLQGPALLAAAFAIKDILLNEDYTLVVYGTPAEETLGGKIPMLKEGYFKELDLALMIHGNPGTTVDVKSMAMVKYRVIFRGRSSHAALLPEGGRSALDALLLSFQGVEFLREHVPDEVRMHYTVLEAGGQANSVPSRAVGQFYLRSYDGKILLDLKKRFTKIIEGAALMTETQGEILEEKQLLAKIPVISLNDLLMVQAKELKAPNIKPPRAKTGSSDFGNVMYEIPGSCLRMDFVPEGTPSHSQEYLDAGKGDKAEICLLTGAKIIAATLWQLIVEPSHLVAIKSEFYGQKK